MNTTAAFAIAKEVIDSGDAYLPLLEQMLNSKGPLTGKLAWIEPYRTEALHVVSFFEWMDGLAKKLTSL